MHNNTNIFTKVPLENIDRFELPSYPSAISYVLIVEIDGTTQKIAFSPSDNLKAFSLKDRYDSLEYLELWQKVEAESDNTITKEFSTITLDEFKQNHRALRNSAR